MLRLVMGRARERERTNAEVPLDKGGAAGGMVVLAVLAAVSEQVQPPPDHISIPKLTSHS